MKSTFQFQRSLLVLLVITSLSFYGISCTGDDVERVSEVKTIVNDFAGNGAVSVGRSGTIYVSEYGVFRETGGDGTRIFRFDQRGRLRDTIQGLSGPMGTAEDSYGNLFVNNDNNLVRGQVLKITPQGTRTVIAEIEGWPSSMAIDYQDNLYISNFTAPTVHKITPDGQVSVLATDPRLAGGVGIDLDSQGNVIVANFSTADFLSITPDGSVSLLTTIPDIVFQDFGIGYLNILNDTIYATGIAVNYIYKVNLDGTFEIIAGNGEAAQVDGPLREASFSNPNGIAVDKKRELLYVTEFSGMGGLRKVELP